MNTHNAPASLAVAAMRTVRTAKQAELIAHCDTVERNIVQLIHAIEATKDFDGQWLARARMDLRVGTMCLRAAITHKDFF
jgi:hypothetical protein